MGVQRASWKKGAGWTLGGSRGCGSNPVARLDLAGTVKTSKKGPNPTVLALSCQN